jgi:hypothetical protein
MAIYYIDNTRTYLPGDSPVTVCHDYASRMGYSNYNVRVLEQTTTGEAVAVIRLLPYKGASESVHELYVYKEDDLAGTDIEEDKSGKIVPHRVGGYRFDGIMRALLGNPLKAYDLLEELGDDVGGLSPQQLEYLAQGLTCMFPVGTVANQIAGLLHYKIDPHVYAAHVQPILCATKRGEVESCHTWDTDTRCFHCNMIDYFNYFENFEMENLWTDVPDEEDDEPSDCEDEQPDEHYTEFF